MSEQQQLEAAIAALEAQRGAIGNVVDVAVAPLRARLQALAAAPVDAQAQSLRQVTILFLDVVGSTSLGQHLDPEQIHAVMDGALARCTEVVAAHHGKVLQYAGDSLLAVFGADEAREDDVERAVLCGLALLPLGRALGADVRAAHGHEGFDVRVGIHTGSVLLGGGVDAAGSIRGIAVNIAARMEQTATAGALRISHDSYAQVRGMFDVERQEPMAVKGVDEPVQSYLVLRAKPRAFRIVSRGIEGVATRMIGRDTELEALQDAFRRVFAERTLAAVTVVAEAGLGKSRLLYEFESWAEARPESYFLFRGRATPLTQGQPYGLLRDVLAWRFQITDDDTLAAARAKLENGIVPLFLADEGADAAEAHAHVLAHLIGIDGSDSRHLRGILDDPRQIRNRAFHAAAQMFRRLGASDGSPIVLQLEDLHWADDASLDFLNYLAEVGRDVPMLVLGLARPTLFERRTDWKSTAGIHQRIDLLPLDKGHSRDLARELLKKLPELPAALRELVIGGAEGNPFYMEELVKMLVDQGAIETHGPHSERWTLHAEKLLATQVPATLTGVLQARLDGLPIGEKLALQEASVIGAVFWDQALGALDQRAREALPALVRRELALPRQGGAIDGLREYAFRHQMLHQVTYNTVLKRSRIELHGKLAHWLSGLTGARANDFLGVTAEHYEKAGDDANAAEFHTRAVEHASARFAHAATLEHTERALALLHRLPPGPAVLSLRWRLLSKRERTLDMLGERAPQRADIDALLALAEALDDDRRRADAHGRRSDMAYRIVDWVTCEAAARRAMLAAERAGDHTQRLLAIHKLSMAVARLGDPLAGQALAQQGLADARAIRLRRGEAMCLNALSEIANLLPPNPLAQLELDRQCLVCMRESGNPRNEASALAKLGAARAKLGDLAPARRDLEEALRLLRANGDRTQECLPLCLLCAVALWQGDDARALVLGRSALDTAVAVGTRDWEAIAQLLIGHAELALGRHVAAVQAFDRALLQGREIDHPLQHDATASLARAALSQGDTAGALRHVEGLLAQLATGATLDGASGRFIELVCHQVLAQAGDARAAEWLERAHTALQATAETIADATLREGFLNQITEHREIMAAWQALHGACGPPA